MIYPTTTWYFSYQVLTKSFSIEDLENYNRYLSHTAHLTFNQLQANTELKSFLSISVLFVHYFINRIEHFQATLNTLAISKFATPLKTVLKNYDLTKCTCIICKFPNLNLSHLDTNLVNFLSSLKTKTENTRLLVLAIFEKIYEIQCIHTTTIQHLFPNMSNDVINQYVTLN